MAASSVRLMPFETSPAPELLDHLRSRHAGVVWGSVRCCGRRWRCSVCAGWPSAILQLHKKPDGPMIMMPLFKNYNLMRRYFEYEFRRFNWGYTSKLIVFRSKIPKDSALAVVSIANIVRGTTDPEEEQQACKILGLPIFACFSSTSQTNLFKFTILII